jgi:hypothetical protein
VRRRDVPIGTHFRYLAGPSCEDLMVACQGGDAYPKDRFSLEDPYSARLDALVETQAEYEARHVCGITLWPDDLEAGGSSQQIEILRPAESDGPKVVAVLRCYDPDLNQWATMHLSKSTIHTLLVVLNKMNSK